MHISKSYGYSLCSRLGARDGVVFSGHLAREDIVPLVSVPAVAVGLDSVRLGCVAILWRFALVDRRRDLPAAMKR